jgi:hypothetical protein
MSKNGKIVIVLLFILVFLSLALNSWLIWQLLRLQQQSQALVQTVRAGLPAAISQLEAFEKATLTYEVPIKQELPIQAEIPFNETLDIPIETSVPISQTINTTVNVDPLGTGLEIPIELNVPVNVEIPVNTTVSIPIERTIPISTTIPLDLNIPLAIKVSETDLAKYIEQLRSGLASLDKVLAELEP